MPKRDRVTISLFSVEKDGGFNRSALGEINNIKVMKERLAEEALRQGRMPPEIVVSELLIPNWKTGSSFEDSSYRHLEAEFYSELRETLDGAGLQDVVLNNFHNKAGPEELGYLNGLQARGSNADMIKTHAIIDPDNVGRRHLQIDSNT
eukprot:CAMPEP_0185031536 /NCGR_PEP_ID=MMETSP1103-20130426/19063_1 /TAXON_ID=36769 /ORGANISM="Paraphysomonas bandaiensis, Strain Caron Lab Isolate" /LENGTH=148 /DNA_ID=CAMNT_0027567089 /DNA_START=368 /DNA_END=810 /DNA_ORIENTATION=-